MNWLPGRLSGWWYRRRRKADVEILWPAILARASGPREARLLFATHTMVDAAWASLSDDELVAAVMALPAPATPAPPAPAPAPD